MKTTVLYFTEPCSCSLDDFRHGKEPARHVKSHKNLEQLSQDSFTNVAPGNFQSVPIYVGICIGSALLVFVLLLIITGIWLGRTKWRKTSSCSPTPKSKSVFGGKNTMKIDFGFLGRSNTEINYGGIYNSNSGGLRLGNSNTVDMLLESSGMSFEGEEATYAAIGNATSSNNVLVLCDDPRLPLVPSKSWSELKSKSIPSIRNSSSTLQNHQQNYDQSNSSTINPKTCTISRKNRTTHNYPQNYPQDYENVRTLSKSNINSSKSINGINLFDDTNGNYSATKSTPNNINNSAMISDMENTEHPIYIRSATKCANVDTNSTGSSTTISSGHSEESPYFIKSTDGFFDLKNEDEIVYSSPAPNFPTEPAKFTSVYAASPAYKPVCQYSTTLPSYPEYSSPLEFERIPPTNSSIYSTITPSYSSSKRPPVPPNVPCVFTAPPPPPPIYKRGNRYKQNVH